MADGLDALAVDDRQAGLRPLDRTAPLGDRRALAGEVQRQADGLVERWPALDPAWLPADRGVDAGRRWRAAPSSCPPGSTWPSADRPRRGLGRHRRGQVRVPPARAPADLHFYALRRDPAASGAALRRSPPTTRGPASSTSSRSATSSWSAPPDAPSPASARMLGAASGATPAESPRRLRRCTATGRCPDRSRADGRGRPRRNPRVGDPMSGADADHRDCWRRPRPGRADTRAGPSGTGSLPTRPGPGGALPPAGRQVAIALPLLRQPGSAPGELPLDPRSPSPGSRPSSGGPWGWPRSRPAGHRRFRTPAEAVGPVADQAVAEWRRTGWRTFHWEPWFAGLGAGGPGGGAGRGRAPGPPRSGRRSTGTGSARPPRWAGPTTSGSARPRGPSGSRGGPSCGSPSSATAGRQAPPVDRHRPGIGGRRAARSRGWDVELAYLALVAALRSPSRPVRPGARAVARRRASTGRSRSTDLSSLDNGRRRPGHRRRRGGGRSAGGSGVGRR